MKSFEYGYYLETPLSHALLMTMRLLGEFRAVRPFMPTSSLKSLLHYTALP